MSCRPVTQCLHCVGGVSVAGNTVLGSSSGSLTVNSPAVFNEAIQVQKQLTMNDGSTLTVNGNAVLGSDSSDSVVVNGVTTFKAGVAFQGPVTLPSGTSVSPSSDQLVVNSLLTAGGSAVIGTSSSDSMTVHAAAAFLGPVSYQSNSSTPATSSVIQFSRRLGTAAVATDTVLGALLFTGWDGATDASNAQIRSVHTVSFRLCPSCCAQQNPHQSTQGAWKTVGQRLLICSCHTYCNNAKSLVAVTQDCQECVVEP